MAIVYEIWRIRWVLQHFKKTTTISLRSLATWSRRIPVEDQSMANRRDKLFFRAKDMLRKAKKSKNGYHPTILSRWTAQASYRRSLVEHNIGEKNDARPPCFGKSRLHSYESWTDTNFKALDSPDNHWWTSTTSTTTPRLCFSKKRMSATTRRVYGGNEAVLQTSSSEQTNASKSESAIRRKWRPWSRCWSENKMEMVQRAARKPAAYYVFVVLVMAEFLTTKLEFMVVAFFKAWRKAVSDNLFIFEHAVSDCRNVVPTIRTCCVHHEHYSLLASTNMQCVLVAQELNGSGLQRHHRAHEKSLSSGQPCHLLAGLYLTFSLPVHHNTKHHLDSTTFSKTILYTEHLFQNLFSRQAALTNRSRTSITRVAETRATPLPHNCKPNGSWDPIAEKMLENFQRSGHSIFRCTSALERGHLKSKGGGRTTIQFTVSDDNVQLLLKFVISVNQLNLYQAEAHLIRELPVDQRAPGKPVALGQMEQEIITQPPLAEVQARDERQWDLLQDYEQRFEKTTRRPEVIQIVLRSRFEFGRSWTIILSSSVTEWSEESFFMQRTHVTSRCTGNLCKRVDRRRCTIRPCLGHKFGRNMGDTALKLKFHLYSKIKPLHGLELWTVLKNTSQKQCRSKRKKLLRGNPLQSRNQHWNRHQQLSETLFRWDRENGTTLKNKDPRNLITSICRNSWLNYFDARKLIERMPEFFMIELLMNARKCYQMIQDIGQTK